MSVLVSQSSVTTELMCDGKYDNGFIANILLSPEFWQSANNYQSY